jgi:hypothetical protein
MGYEWVFQLGKWLTAGYGGHFQVILVLLNCSILFPFNVNQMPGTEFKEPLNQMWMTHTVAREDHICCMNEVCQSDIHLKSPHIYVKEYGTMFVL